MSCWALKLKPPAGGEILVKRPLWSSRSEVRFSCGCDLDDFVLDRVEVEAVSAMSARVGLSHEMCAREKLLRARAQTV